MRPLLISLLITAVLLTGRSGAQFQMPDVPTISGDEALDRALRNSSLTLGGEPFHAVLEISGPTPAYSGHVDLQWVAPQRYRLSMQSPGFQQLRIVDGERMEEQNTGDFLPRWLEEFSDALLNPLPVESLFRGRQQPVAVADTVSSCLRRDDRPGGITDQLTWGIVCFSGSKPHLLSELTFNHSLEFADFRSFNKQSIARTYTTDVLDYKEVKARLVTLENLKDTPADLLAITKPTPVAQQLTTKFVSTLQEESMIESAPQLTWPSVREGKTDGYMIVYARTDRTGQVRETAKHNSDNPGLEQFGMEQALRYKFKPLLIDGVAQQMEMPLVLHFSSKLENPLPELDDAQTRAQISGCSLPKAKNGQPPFRLSVSVNEDGMLTGEGPTDANNPNAPHRSSVPNLSLRECRFKPLIVNGHATYYHGILLLP